MRPVSSPTVRPLGVMAAFLLVVSVLVAGARPAAAASPQAPGSFTGLGFDTCVAPSSTVMDAWNLTSPYAVVGIYTSGSSRYCGDKYQPYLSPAWVKRNAAKGWRFLPIHVGYQAPCFVNNPKSRVQKKRMSSTVSTARKQARTDADEAVAAAKRFGFGTGSVLYLDLEAYDRRKTSCNTAVLEFVDAFTERVHAARYKVGLYSSGSAAIAAVDAARVAKRSGLDLPDQMWVAWPNKKADVDGGPYLADAAWKTERLHQFHNGVTVKHGGYAINIDRNALRVGGGSKASAEPRPCQVPMTFAAYGTLQTGSAGDQVKALQCLLKAQGLKKSVTGGYGSGTVKGVDAYRKRHGWKQTGTVDRTVWTALLSEGSTPLVLKRGSVGEPVWRLQRTLRAAGAKVTVNGVYDVATEKAVRAYRSGVKLPAYDTAEARLWTSLRAGKHL